MLAAWLPHMLLLVLLISGIGLLFKVFSPVLEPILLSAALALLTSPILFSPTDRLLHRMLPWLGESTRRQASGILATGALVALIALPLLLTLASVVGVGDGFFALAWGIVVKDPQQIDRLEQALASIVMSLHSLYPRLELPEQDLPAAICAAIQQATDVGGTLVGVFFHGSSALAQGVLSLIMLAFLYAHGPRLVHAVLDFSPLDLEQKQELLARHRQVVLRLLSDSVATAAAKGLALGLLAWAVDRGLGQGLLPVVPVMLLATVIALLPLVGGVMVWLPLAAFQYTSEGGGWVPAAVMALGGIAINIILGWLRSVVGRRIAGRGEWMGFLLFLGLVGGVLGFGVKGFIIGPMSVVFAYALGSFWLPLYGVGRKPAAVDSCGSEQLSGPCPPPMPPHPPT